MKKLALSGFAILLALGLASCGGGSSSVDPTEEPTDASTTAPSVAPTEAPTGEEAKGFSIIDVKGRKVEFEEHAKTAICLGAGALRLYSYVGDMDKLIAVEDYEKLNGNKPTRAYQFVYNEKIEALPSCGKGGPGKPSYDYELLVTLNPDVIFTCDKAEAAELDGISQKTNTPVVAIDYGKTHVFNKATEGNPFRVSLSTIAEVMGTTEKYTKLVTYIDEKLEQIETLTGSVNDENKHSTYFGGVGKKRATGLECSQQHHPILDAIHAKNILDDLTFNISEQLKIDKEFLSTLNPERVLIDLGGLNDVKTQLQTPGEKEIFKGWDALTNGNTYVMLPYGDYNTQTECSLINAMFATTVCFDNVNTSFDVNTFGGEVFEAFYGKNVFEGYLSANEINNVVFHSPTF